MKKQMTNQQLRVRTQLRGGIVAAKTPTPGSCIESCKGAQNPDQCLQTCFPKKLS